MSRRERNNSVSPFIEEGGVDDGVRRETTKLVCSSSVRCPGGGMLKRCGAEKGLLELQTVLLCWNCAHSFECPPVAIPTKKISQGEPVELLGNFCGFPCAKRYLLDSNDLAATNQRLLWLASLARRWGYSTTITAAPPFQALYAFSGVGGMTIEEYRGNSCDVERVEEPFISFPLVFSGLLPDVQPRKAADNDNSAQRVSEGLYSKYLATQPKPPKKRTSSHRSDSSKSRGSRRTKGLHAFLAKKSD